MGAGAAGGGDRDRRPSTHPAVGRRAFGTRAPLVDGNVERVLCRLVAQDADPRKAPGKRALWALAEQLVDARSPGDFNQALMELGATVCVPKNPACTTCPWQSDCVAFARGEQTAYPKLGARTEARPHRLLYLVVLAPETGEVYLVKRPSTGRFAGMWEPPSLEADAVGRSASAAAKRLARELGLGRAPVLRDCGGYEHVLSHLRIDVSVFATVVSEPRPLPLIAPFVEGHFSRIDAARGQSRLASRALELALGACGLHAGEPGR